MQEKRRNPRFDCDSTNPYFVDFPEMQTTGRLFNLSRSGISFNLPRKLRENAVYDFTIKVGQTEKQIPCKARVVWITTDQESQQCLYGANIEEMDPSDKIELLDLFYEKWKQKIITNNK